MATKPKGIRSSNGWLICFDFYIMKQIKMLKNLKNLQETVEDSKDADKYRILGELLTASLHLIKRGDRKVETVNYYDEDQAKDKNSAGSVFNPSENAQRYFKKYTKMKNSTADCRGTN